MNGCGCGRLTSTDQWLALLALSATVAADRSGPAAPDQERPTLASGCPTMGVSIEVSATTVPLVVSTIRAVIPLPRLLATIVRTASRLASKCTRATFLPSTTSGVELDTTQRAESGDRYGLAWWTWPSARAKVGAKNGLPDSSGDRSATSAAVPLVWRASSCPSAPMKQASSMRSG